MSTGLPKTVRIGRVEYRITIDRDEWLRIEHRTKTTGFYGQAAMGSPDWDHLGKDKTSREEQVIRLLEAPTLNVLADNPDLVAYLTE